MRARLLICNQRFRRKYPVTPRHREPPQADASPSFDIPTH
ncbi:hypothetical protein D187_001747 [Cystobacter fuscus DSM 2262]|uniref:Uncharacterized protein n=1 Tax=Cystobacter fuscus (strain ATCC 25194 / DSM 2262 / NBRC 100088 / M29) TaxID=1242864 RepID=S9QVC2_CYSF2|nr:hypothetical protein D187_001747 [Cystobacter fuscus DSM 2262]